MANLRKFEWEAMGGLFAAVTALVLHFLRFSDANILRVITLVLVALLFLRELRNEDRWDKLDEASQRSVQMLQELKAAMPEPEVDLIGPSRLRCATVQFAGRCQGSVVWFNACPAMLASQALCDTLPYPFLVNPRVSGRAVAATRVVVATEDAEGGAVRVLGPGNTANEERGSNGQHQDATDSGNERSLERILCRDEKHWTRDSRPPRKGERAEPGPPARFSGGEKIRTPAWFSARTLPFRPRAYDHASPHHRQNTPREAFTWL